jgi:glycosyltransferase involved in cell wall biosynthesis
MSQVDSRLRGLRVLLVGNDPEYFLMHRLPLVRALAAGGIDLHVAIPFVRDDPRFKGHEFTLHPLSLHRGSVNPFGELRTARELAALNKRIRPTLLHHITLKPVLYGSAVARACGTPHVVNSITGLGYVFSRDTAPARTLRALVLPLMRYGCNRSNVTMLFENTDDRDVYCSLGITELSRCHIVPSSGIEPEHYPAHEHRPGAVTVMLLGRMLWDKGVREFVEAARRVRAQLHEVSFVLVGGTDPNPESIPEAQLQGWHQEGVVEYWGWRSDVPGTLGRADILCLPSYREGLPRALLEGGASGLALVATDVPGCRDAVVDGVSGLLVPLRDPEALANAILTIGRDFERRKAMGAAARVHATARFSVTSVVAQTCAVYSEALGRMS